MSDLNPLLAMRLQEIEARAREPDSPLSARIAWLRAQHGVDPAAARRGIAELLRAYPENRKLLLLHLEDRMEEGDSDGVAEAIGRIQALPGDNPDWLDRYIAALRDGWIRQGPVRLAVDADMIDPWILRFMAMGQYEAQEADLLAETLTPGDSVVELGAGVGFMALMVRHLAPGARYRGAEANPQLFDLIRRNLAMAGAEDIDIRNEILGRSEGTEPFYLAQRYWSSSLVRAEGTEAVQVPALRLADVLKEQEASYLLIDIEGGEYDLLPHVELGPVQKVLIEMHPERTDRRTHSAALRSLLEAGFELDGALSKRNVLYLERPGARTAARPARRPLGLHPDLTLRKPAETEPGPGDVTVYTTARNEARNLPYFLDYYRGLGVRRFVVADNESTDESVDFLMRQPDVCLYEAKGSYWDAQSGMDWANSLVDMHDLNRWILHADADELLVYPGCEQLSLPGLVRVLEVLGADGLFTFMLDCYADAPALAQPYVPGEPFFDHAPFFDGAGYTAIFQHKPGLSSDLRVQGGMRHRFFQWRQDESLRMPVLKKIPLLRNSGGGVFRGSHSSVEMRLCGLTGVLMHFKFLGRDLEVLQEDIDNGGRGGTQAYFQAYVNAFEKDAEAGFMDRLSVRYEDSLQLVELGLLALPKPTVGAILQELKGVCPRKERQGLFQRMTAARERAAERFRPSLGHALQLLDRY